MIKNKLKITDSKTEFIIYRSPLLKQNLSDLSVSVGDMQVSPSSKVRAPGVFLKSVSHFSLAWHRKNSEPSFDATAQLIHALTL